MSKILWKPRVFKIQRLNLPKVRSPSTDTPQFICWFIFTLPQAQLKYLLSRENEKSSFLHVLFSFVVQTHKKVYL